MTTKKTVWSLDEIRDKLMNEAQFYVNAMNTVYFATELTKEDWDEYQRCYEKAMSILDVLSMFTDEDYTVRLNKEILAEEIVKIWG